MKRLLVSLSALALMCALGAPALAGGWAATTLDDLPPNMQAGTEYAIGYTIRQHGVTPVNVEDMQSTTQIRITAPTGAKTLSDQGVQTGAKGHYDAKVLFPYDGDWTWQVTQGPFAPLSLGVVLVAPAGGAPPAPAQPVAAAAPAQQPAGSNPFLVTALLLASVGAAILFGTRVAALAGRRATA
jgi:hypothetical protein